MLLQALYDLARKRRLVDEIELTNIAISLTLEVGLDGQVRPGSAWMSVTDANDPKKRGQLMRMPRFPGADVGGKANFLYGPCSKILGIDAETGKVIPDQPVKPTVNATKAFHHFWQRVKDACEATGNVRLQALLKFRDRYLKDESAREQLPFVTMTTIGKSTKPVLTVDCGAGPVELEGKNITFRVDGDFIFDGKDPELLGYWKKAYAAQTFGEGEGSDEGDGGEGEGEPSAKGKGGKSKPSKGEAWEGRKLSQGLCMITGQDGQTIAASHTPQIKGVPGLPPLGGYLISFAKEAPSFASYGFEGTENAPISQLAVAAYALALNDLLSNAETARRINDFAICSWVRDDPEDLSETLDLLNDAAPDQVKKLFDSVGAGGNAHVEAIDPNQFYSVTFAANGGRVVVRRWLNLPLPEVKGNLVKWFKDLELDVIERPKTEAKSKAKASPKGKGKAKDQEQGAAAATDEESAQQESRPMTYRALWALASVTARTSKDIRSEVYDALYRAAFEGANPTLLLSRTLARLRVATIESGSNVRYQASRFALLKLILNRMEDRNAMKIEPQLCETHDAAYNCGRLLAVLDSLQFSAHKGEVGADILARYYGRASTVPGNVFPSLLSLSQSHLKKLGRGDKGGLAHFYEKKISQILALFPPKAPTGSPEFPNLMSTAEQGRFALGFYQQKAADFREREKKQAAKKAASA